MAEGRAPCVTPNTCAAKHLRANIQGKPFPAVWDVPGMSSLDEQDCPGERLSSLASSAHLRGGELQDPTPGMRGDWLGLH